MGFPFIGSSIDDPLFLRSSNRSSLDSRTNRSFPKTPKNMFPFTNAEMLPNIGRTVTRSSFGTRDRKTSTDSLSGRGIFNPVHAHGSKFPLRVDEVFRNTLGDLGQFCLITRWMDYACSGEYS